MIPPQKILQICCIGLGFWSVCFEEHTADHSSFDLVSAAVMSFVLARVTPTYWIFFARSTANRVQSVFDDEKSSLSIRSGYKHLRGGFDMIDHALTFSKMKMLLKTFLQGSSNVGQILVEQHRRANRWKDLSLHSTGNPRNPLLGTLGSFAQNSVSAAEAHGIQQCLLVYCNGFWPLFFSADSLTSIFVSKCLKMSQASYI